MTESAAHAELMNRIYRHQRWIYNLSRKFFLLGRDRLIGGLDAQPNGTILEVACGTGRNLAKIADRHPDARLYGFDLSDEMLKSARRALNGRAELAQADACTFDGKATFGVATFDRIIISYGLSMMPCWRTALATAANHLSPGGSLHLVDFGGQTGLPRWVDRLLRSWLAMFHVSPREGISDVLRHLAVKHGGTVEHKELYRDYAQYGVMRVGKQANSQQNCCTGSPGGRS
ncbi:MAG: class I SAM-dependent methyltransferase [Alphaproteobacteria bacterium]|nr:class I SAM-dependent methyltransferase [Alphaproteobacteria bacterium]